MERRFRNQLHLDKFFINEQFRQLPELLAPFQNSISDSWEFLGRRKEELQEEDDGNDEDYWVDLLYEQSQLIDENLGIVFVVCQRYVASTTAFVSRLHQRAKVLNIELKTTTGKAFHIMGFGNRVIPKTSYTDIQLIHSLANYYKHRDQWVGDWTKLKDDQQAKTAKVLLDVGILQEKRSSVFSHGAEILGNPQGRQVRKFADILLGWEQNVVQAYETELGSLGLI